MAKKQRKKRQRLWGIAKYHWLDPKYWTYGAEHELSDWDTRRGWEGYGRDPEPQITNTNGIAGDPTLKDYPFGAEINTPPTDTPDGQAQLFHEFLTRFPETRVTHRAGTQVHIRVPGLRERGLEILKRIQTNCLNLRPFLEVIDPLDADYYPCETTADRKLLKQWLAHIKRSHWTIIPEYRVRKQLEAKTVEELISLECPWSKAGKPLYHAQPRPTVNIRQLLQSDTIEFRPFFQAETPEQVLTAIELCRDLLICLIEGTDPLAVYWERYAHREFPPRPKFLGWRERRWQATSYSKNTRAIVARNRQAILEGRFDDVSNEPYKHLYP